MTDLLELADRVEAGERLYIQVDKALGFKEDVSVALALNGSLDAAKALHEAVLPEWRLYDLSESDLRTWLVVLLKRGAYPPDPVTSEQAPTAAVAWVVAILRAKHSMEN